LVRWLAGYKSVDGTTTEAAWRDWHGTSVCGWHVLGWSIVNGDGWWWACEWWWRRDDV